jgi:hypothetical protein
MMEMLGLQTIADLIRYALEHSGGAAPPRVAEAALRDTPSRRSPSEFSGGPP